MFDRKEPTSEHSRLPAIPCVPVIGYTINVLKAEVHQLAEETDDPDLPYQLDAYLSNLHCAISPPSKDKQAELQTQITERIDRFITIESNLAGKPADDIVLPSGSPHNHPKIILHYPTHFKSTRETLGYLDETVS